MTDELMIQPQVQPRKQANPLVYGTVGALAGAGAGALVNQTEFIKGKKIGSVQDIINDANSKDKAEFSSKYSSAPEAAKDKLMAEAAEVKRLKDEIKNLPSKTLPADAEEAKALEAVKKEREEAITKKIAELEKNGSGTITKGNKILDFSDRKIEPKDWPSLNQNGKKIRDLSQVQSYYDYLKDEVKNAEAGFNTEIRTADKAATDAQKAVDDYFKQVYKDFNGKKHAGTEVNKAFNKKEYTWISTLFGDRKVPKGNYGKAFNVAKSIYPEPSISSLKLEDYEKFADISETRPKGRSISFQVFNPETGKKDITKYASFTEDARRDYLNNLKKEVYEKQISFADEIYDAAREGFFKQRNVDAKHIKETYATSEGLFEKAEAGKLIKDEKIDVDRLLNEYGSVKNKFHKPGKLAPKSGYLCDILALKDAKGKGGAVPANLNGDYGSVKNIDKLIEIAKARQELFEDYEKFQKDSKNVTRKLAEEMSVVRELKEKADSLKANDPKYQEALAKFKEEFPMFFKEGTVEGGRSAEELRRMAENSLSADLKSRFKDAETKFNKAVESKGVANGEAKAALESKLATAESNVTKFAEEMCTKGGKNKLLAPIIGGVALFLAGLGFANSKNS